MKKILIVDDEVSYGDMLRLNLELTGEYEVRSECGGDYGIDTAKKFKPDLILLDIMMPDKDGFQVLEALKQDKVTASIPVVMLSALRSQMTKDKAGLLGDEDYIEKPFTVEQLIEKVESVLKKG